MTEILQLRVDGTKLTIEELPSKAVEAPDSAAEGARAIACAVTFDEGWNGFSGTLLLRHRGEAPLAVKLKPLAAEATGAANGRRTAACLLPKPFTADVRPFFLSIEGAQRNPGAAKSAGSGGSGGTCRLRTNDVCAALRPALQGENRVTCYEGPYTLRENKTYALADTFLQQDLTVDVPTVDLTQDTVTPGALLQGVTAHNAAGEPITGTLSGLNLVCSERAPKDTSKLWVKTTVQPEMVTVDAIRPAWKSFSMQGRAARTRILRWISDASGCLYAYGVERSGEGYGPRLLRFSPDGSTEQAAAGQRVFPSLPDARALDGCVGERYAYLLLGASGAGGIRRPVRLYRFDLEQATGQVCEIVDADCYFALTGGVTTAEDGSVFLYTNACASPGAAPVFRAYRYRRDALFPLGEEILCGGNGDGGMARIGDTAYTPAQTEDGRAVLLHLPSERTGTWCSGGQEEAMRVEGASDGMLFYRYPYGLRVFDPRTGVTGKINCCTEGADSAEKRIYSAWTTAGENLFVVSTDRGVPQYALLPRKASGSALRLCTGVEEGVRLPLYSARGQMLYADISGAFVSDASGVWHFAEVYRHDGTLWTRAVPK